MSQSSSRVVVLHATYTRCSLWIDFWLRHGHSLAGCGVEIDGWIEVAAGWSGASIKIIEPVMLMYTCDFSLLAELFMCAPDLGHSSYNQRIVMLEEEREE